MMNNKQKKSVDKIPIYHKQNLIIPEVTFELKLQPRILTGRDVRLESKFQPRTTRSGIKSLAQSFMKGVSKWQMLVAYHIGNSTH